LSSIQSIKKIEEKMFKVKEMLEETFNAGASDLHISAGSIPMVRVHGQMKKLNLPVLNKEQVEELLNDVITESQKEILKKNLEIDFSMKIKDSIRFRVNAFHQLNGLAASFRMIPNKIKSFEELGLPEIIQQLASKEKGLILITGPNGSGKSTTLAAMIDWINNKYHKHIITIEDPIEFVHYSKNSLINQREIGQNSKDYPTAIKSALREDPDVIFIGEMNDYETIALALTAAETGHLVLATLHTSSTTKSLDRIMEMFPKEQQPKVRSQLAECLEAIITQSLVPQQNSSGRLPVHEILIANSAVRNLIREEKTYQIPSIIYSGTREGMQSKDQALNKLFKKGIIDKCTAEQFADNSRIFG
jgi:twitching motility protein PilT